MPSKAPVKMKIQLVISTKIIIFETDI